MLCLPRSFQPHAVDDDCPDIGITDESKLVIGIRRVQGNVIQETPGSGDHITGELMNLYRGVNYRVNYKYQGRDW